MRYRVDNYKITVDNGYVYVHFQVDNTSYLVTNPMQRAVRLVVDETAKVVFCSSMQKDKILEVASSSETDCNMKLKFAIPTGKTVTTTDQFTIELDFGEAPADLAQEASLGDLAAALDYIEDGGLPSLSDNIARQGTNANANISDIQANTVNLAALVNNTLTTSIITSGIVSMAGVPVVEVAPTDTTLVADPNKLYLISGRTGTGAADLSISLHEPSSQSTDVQEYHFLFDGGATSTITWEPIYYETAQADQTSIIWQQGLPPQLSGGQDFYEVGILNGVGLWMYYASSNN